MSAAVNTVTNSFYDNKYDFHRTCLQKLDTSLDREVYEEGTLHNGWNYTVQKLRPEDSQAVYALLEAEYNNPKNAGKKYLVRRNLAKVQKMLDKGDSILAVVLEDGSLAAVSSVTPVADKEDMGRGKAYEAPNCPPKQQLYFGMAVIDPLLQNEDFGFLKILYPHRLAEALNKPNRTCFLTKTNHPKVMKAYTGLGWELVDDSIVEDGEVLFTYKCTDTQGYKWLQTKHPDVLKRHGLGFAHQANLMTDVPAFVSVNDNDLAPRPQQIPVLT